MPGNDGSPSIGGVVNTHYAAAVGTHGPASSSIALGNRRGAATEIGPGDLALVIQMQCATIDVSDSLACGSGVDAEPASGYADPVGICLAGRHECVRAGPGSSAGSLDLTGSPLQATYVQACATTAAGRRTVQVIRVPQYQDRTLAGTVTASPWNGLNGGIVALDVAVTLDLNGHGVTVDGLGFRGGGGKTQSANDSQQRFRWDDTTRHASKGEGIAGTPRFVSEKRSPDSGATAAITDLGAGWGGYPTGTARTGDYARGAPGTAGGGGTYWSGSSDNAPGGPAHGAATGASGVVVVVAAADDTPGSTAGYRCQIDLSLAKLASLTGPEPGDEVVYQLTITNLSPAPASGVQIGESLPTGLLVLTTSGCAEDPGGVPVCTIGTIPSLATRPIPTPPTTATAWRSPSAAWRCRSRCSTPAPRIAANLRTSRPA